MAYRKAIKNIKRDKRVFSRTAAKTKRINSHPKITRGGTRL